MPSCPLFFDNAPIGEDSRLGPEGGAGFKVAMEALNTSRPIVAARAVGIAQGAIDHTVKYIQERRAFGQAVGDFQGVRWMIADMQMQTEAARQLVYRTASMVDAAYEELYEFLRPGVRENECVGLVSKVLFDLGSEQVEGVNAISGERCSPHPHVFSDRLLRPGEPPSSAGAGR